MTRPVKRPVDTDGGTLHKAVSRVILIEMFDVDKTTWYLIRLKAKVNNLTEGVISYHYQKGTCVETIRLSIRQDGK